MPRGHDTEERREFLSAHVQQPEPELLLELGGAHDDRVIELGVAELVEQHPRGRDEAEEAECQQLGRRLARAQEPDRGARVPPRSCA